MGNSSLADVSPASNAATVFINRWGASVAAERANYQLFLAELCDVLGVERPAPTTGDDATNTYVFEKAVTFPNADGTTSSGRIDLYRRGHFVCETKQGSEKKREESDLVPKVKSKTGHGVRGTHAWDAAMVAARGQAERYVRAIPDDNPPFVLVMDVGYSIEVYSDFSRLGKIYTPFPDARSHRIFIKDLANPDLRERLKLVWTNPLALDPARRSAKVTREIADKLAKLAKSLEGEKHDPEAVAGFLMRCLFTLFAEDVELLKETGGTNDQPFTKLLADVQSHPDQFVPMVHDVWRAMDGGEFSPALRRKLMRFNGGLFADQTVLKLSPVQLKILHEAAKSDWKHVEPAIFGTLLERALDPTERHKLGAYYTPRAYVERLVLPTIIEPLRDEWDAAKAAAITLANAGKRKEAVAEVRKYLQHLCSTIVLDPACGSGNFLYVTLEHMKRLEGEVRDQLQQFGESQQDFEGMNLTVDPHQFKGIEINPRAAHIADLVLWIGYLQWHFRVYGNTPPREPVLKAFNNIENRDAVLAYDKKELVTDDAGKPVSRWDGRTMKTHPVTGENVPDDSARVPVYRYVNPRKAEWPKADFVVGNPPYLGARTIRQALGDGYLLALRSVFDRLPDHIDFVMYWWEMAATAVSAKSLRRFGFITTKSVGQSFSRKVLDRHVGNGKPLSVVFAVPNHPWVDSSDGADVRVAMTVGQFGQLVGDINRVASETCGDHGEAHVELAKQRGKILSNLTIGADVVGVSPLRANEGLSCVGYQLSGQGFSIDPEVRERLADGAEASRVIRPLLSGRDLAQAPRGKYAIDLFGLTADEVRERFPRIYQWVCEHVKPERDQNSRKSTRENWWLFGEQRSTFRPALAELSLMVACSITAKHRVFVRASAGSICDSTCVMFALEDAFFLGVMSSRAHVDWATRAGGRLGVGDDPRYLKAECFDPFPFPVPTDAQRSRIRELGEQLDAHRKRQQAAHPGLTITDMYNVLEKLRSGQALTAKEKTTHEHGLVSVLKQIHDDLDAAVFEAYGWPATLTDEQVLERLVALNAERAAEEQRSLIRWLRPEFQDKTGAMAQPSLDLPDAQPKSKRAKSAKPAKATKVAKQPWPPAMAEQAKALRAVLSAVPQDAKQLAVHFRRANTERIADLLDTLVSLGQARRTGAGKFTK